MDRLRCHSVGRSRVCVRQIIIGLRAAGRRSVGSRHASNPRVAVAANVAHRPHVPGDAQNGAVTNVRHYRRAVSVAPVLSPLRRPSADARLNKHDGDRLTHHSCNTETGDGCNYS